MELRETVKCDFRENFHVCSPRRDLPFDTTPDPLTQLGEGLGGPKIWGRPQKSPTSGFPGSKFFTP